jgi:hypothetical protein
MYDEQERIGLKHSLPLSKYLGRWRKMLKHSKKYPIQYSIITSSLQVMYTSAEHTCSLEFNAFCCVKMSRKCLILKRSRICEISGSHGGEYEA